jgi:hypothetical protein
MIEMPPLANRRVAEWGLLYAFLSLALSEGVRSSTRDILKNIHRNSKGLMNYYNSSQIHFPHKLEPV